jgi:hypothetical protein
MKGKHGHHIHLCKKRFQRPKKEASSQRDSGGRMKSHRKHKKNQPICGRDVVKSQHLEAKLLADPTATKMLITMDGWPFRQAEYLFSSTRINVLLVLTCALLGHIREY